MGIEFTCECGRQLRLRDELAGKRGKCPACGRALTVPSPAVPANGAEPTSGYWRSSLTSVAAKAKLPSERLEPVTRSWRDYFYFVLLVALLPLALALRGDGKLSERFDRTVAASSQGVQDAVANIRAHFGIEGPTPAWLIRAMPTTVVQAFPGERVEGALLARSSGAHWWLGAIAAACYLGIAILIFPTNSESAGRMLGAALFTAVIGVLLLLGIQAIAEASRGVIVVGGILTIPWLLFRFIGASYGAAGDPNANFFISFFGFMCSVGFLEELVKALPLMWRYRKDRTLGWREACAWGLASGAAFGAVEGIFYSADFYNGIEGGGTYLVRFASCVALHAVWTASVALAIHKHQRMLQEVQTWRGFFGPALSFVAAAMLLHGLYDAFLKKQFVLFALATAIASFAWLAWYIEDMRKLELRRPGAVLANG